MKSLFVSVLAFSVAATLAYDFQLYKTEIDQRCLAQLWSPQNSFSQLRTGGLTMESFISMVEKVERNHTDWDIYQVSRVLLKRFAFDGIVYKELNGQRTPKQTSEHQIRWQIIKKLLGSQDETEHFREEDLSEEEKCTMFFMMGHLVNSTFREGIDDESVALLNPIPVDKGSNDYLRSPGTGVKESKFPREQGVVSINGEKRRAIAIGKILNAILASQNSQDISITEVFDVPEHELTRNVKVNILIGVSLADVVSFGAIHHKPGVSGLEFYGPGGEWNSSLCPTEFTLRENTTGATNALLRGAIDGLQIGFALHKMPSLSSKDLRLSRILRMYYSNTGIPTDSPTTGVSFCDRTDVLTAGPGTNVIMESFKGFYLVHNYKELGQLPENTGLIDTAYSNLQQAIRRLDDFEKEDQECKLVAREVDRPICETPSNVFVILDDSEIHSDGFNEQEEIVGHLAHRLDFGKGAGSLSVFHGSRNGAELKPVFYNATNPSCAACHTARIDRRMSVSTENTADMLEAINRTLQNFELRTDLLSAVPNKVVIWFHYKEPNEKDVNRLKKAANVLRDGHRDTRVLVVGRLNPEVLSQMSTSLPDAITTSGNAGETAERLAKKICQVPAVLQYNQCWNSKNRNEETYKQLGYVSGGSVQFWAMYPEYFLKSFDIEFKFKAENGDLKVCSNRGDPNPGFNIHDDKLSSGGNCQTTESNKKELIFRFKDPCHKFHVGNCQSINFAVVGVTNSANGNSNRQILCPGDDDNCRRLDQIKYTLTHRGISCSGCEFLKASPLALLLISILYFFTKSS